MVENFISVHNERKVIEGLNLDVEKFEHYLNLFKNWIASQNNLPQTYSDNCIKKFLLWAKLDFEKAKKRFEAFCYNPVTHKEFLRNRVVTLDGDLKGAEHSFSLPMSKLTPKGYKVTVAGVSDGDNFDLQQILRFSMLEYDIRVHKDCMVAGELVVFDLKHLKRRHYTKLFTPSVLRYFKLSVQNYHYIMKGTFVINCDPAMKRGVDLCKTVVPAKIANRVMILTDPQELLKYIPSYCLPSDYGGSCKSIEELKEDFINLLIENKDLLEEVSRTIPVGPLPEQIKQLSDEFGIDGSFRMLNID